MTKMRKRSKMQISDNRKMIPGNHIVKFYRDEKSGHPFMGISEFGTRVYGHEMTTHPARKNNKKPRAKYQMFHKNPSGDKETESFYKKTVKKIINEVTVLGPLLKLKRLWKIGKRDLKILKNLDKKRIKNVRRADH